MIVLGIDPSSISTGYGLIEEVRQRQCRYLDCGCIRPSAGLAFEDRLVFIYDHLTQLLKECPPDAVAVESTFFGKDADAAAKLGQARGVILLAARKAGQPISHYPPAEVKKAVVGHGRATKEQVRFMVCRILALKEVPKPLDASDALAIALCHLYQPARQLPSLSSKRRPEIEALLQRVVKR